MESEDSVQNCVNTTREQAEGVKVYYSQAILTTNQSRTMKIKFITFFLVIFAAISCGKKSTVGPPQFEGTNAFTNNNDAAVIEQVDVHKCIDDKLTKDLDSGDSIKKMVVNDDFTFCNGVRIRLKTYQFSSNKYKAYGHVQSNSGYESCLTESPDFTHRMLLGDQGVLIGNDIKILIGGHQLDSDNKILPSEHRLARYVKFTWGSYSGELAIFEKGKLRCWGIQ